MTSSAPEDRLRRRLEEHERDRASGPGRYERRGELGRGGAAVVYRAWDRKLGREVALKVLRDREIPEQLAARFQREIQIAVRLAHPNVVALYDTGEEDGQTYLVMELVDGRPLSAMIGELDFARSARILEKAARGVAAAHALGIVHRDLKPGNILVTAAGEPKIADFGLAHPMDSDVALTATGAVLGTPLYMAPEQAKAEEITPRTDVYALGAILYEMLTGTPPHQGSGPFEVQEKAVRETPVPPRGRRKDVPRELEAVCLKAIEKDPALRYADAAEFADDLGRYLRGEPVRARPSSPIARKLARHKLAILFAIVAAAGVALFVRARARESAYEKAMGEGMNQWNRAVKSGDPSRAEPHFRKAADLMPGKPQPWHMLGLCRQLAGDEAEALRFWDRALQRDPDFMPARFERGKHYLVAYAARSAPPPARIVEGRVRFGPAESGALDLRTKGEADLRAVKPERSEAAFLEGALAYGDGRFAAAAAALARYVEAESWDPEGQALLGLALYHAREFDRAIGPLSAAIRVQPRPEWRRARANAYHCLGRYADSIADNEALGDLCNLGHALHGAGRVEEAEAAFTKALEKDPQHARAANGRGISRWARRDFPGAEEDFQLAIRIAPAFLEAIFNLGLLKWRLGRFREAEEDFDFAVQIDPGWADAWAWRAAARQMEGRKGEAERDYRKAMELDPANPEHPFALAKMIKSPELVRKALEIGGPAWPRIEEARGILREWEK